MLFDLGFTPSLDALGKLRNAAMPEILSLLFLDFPPFFQICSNEEPELSLFS